MYDTGRVLEEERGEAFIWVYLGPILQYFSLR